MNRHTTKPETKDYSEIMKEESDKITSKIDESFGKLANKLRGKADKAKEKLGRTKKEAKRSVLLRRFELYADAAQHLEDHLAPRREGGSD
ncbi:hypothetical protein [Methylobacterium sp. WL64]|uniref:hypothetical protein n=1 Tax=Methylobacterium sp. WL64 TaxID=2603894 RepID=UPI001FED9D1C|nr:hypothetical protein [Methylobacterium sp. WL64]